MDFKDICRYCIMLFKNTKQSDLERAIVYAKHYFVDSDYNMKIAVENLERILKKELSGDDVRYDILRLYEKISNLYKEEKKRLLKEKYAQYGNG